jgi:hypothetical protein
MEEQDEREYNNEHDDQEETFRHRDRTERFFLQWEAPEFIFHKKKPFWYWMVGIISTLGAIDAYLWDRNVLFAGLIILGGAMMLMYADKQPKIISFGLTNRGVIVDGILHPFMFFDSFWLVEKKNENLLILMPVKKWSQQLIIPLGNIDLDDIQEKLSDYLPEIQDSEPLAHKIMDYLGF